MFAATRTQLESSASDINGFRFVLHIFISNDAIHSRRSIRVVENYPFPLCTYNLLDQIVHTYHVLFYQSSRWTSGQMLSVFCLPVCGNVYTFLDNIVVSGCSIITCAVVITRRSKPQNETSSAISNRFSPEKQCISNLGNPNGLSVGCFALLFIPSADQKASRVQRVCVIKLSLQFCAK